MIPSEGRIFSAVPLFRDSQIMGRQEQDKRMLPRRSAKRRPVNIVAARDSEAHGAWMVGSSQRWSSRVESSRFASFRGRGGQCAIWAVG